MMASGFTTASGEAYLKSVGAAYQIKSLPLRKRLYDLEVIITPACWPAYEMNL
jgi:hypothetical protein